MKRIIVYTQGDSSQISTWSNIPYCLTQSLAKKGFSILRVNIQPNYRLKKLWDKIILPSLNKLCPSHSYDYSRSLLHRLHIQYKIIKASIRNRNIYAHIFLTFSHTNFFSKSTIMLCDWTLEEWITKRETRKPLMIEKIYFTWEKLCIDRSRMVVSLFDSFAKRMRLKYNNPNIVFIDQLCVNNLYEYELCETDILEKKKHSNSILFIGRDHYKEGFQKLYNVFLQLHQKNCSLRLHVIGLTDDDVEIKNSNVIFHGFLHKEVKSERELFYQLLIDAKLICNVNPDWAGYSSIIECMYFYTPVVVTPFHDFVKDFGSDIKFGSYYSPDMNISLDFVLDHILTHQNYKQLCINAHDAVKNRTWEKYTDKLLYSFEMLTNGSK